MSETFEGLERRKLARGLKIFLDVFVVLILLAAVLRVIGLSISAFTAYDDGWEFDVPVAVGEGSFYTRLPVESVHGAGPALISRWVSQARGRLIFHHDSLPLHLGGEALALFFYGALIWGITMLRRILATTAAGCPFDRLNPRRLNTLGWIIVVSVAVASLLQYLVSRWVLSRFESVTVPLAPSIDANLEWLMCGLVVLVLAAIWREAVLMAEEQSLTV